MCKLNLFLIESLLLSEGSIIELRNNTQGIYFVQIEAWFHPLKTTAFRIIFSSVFLFFQLEN